jgi:acyl-CoA thioester hydrolase
MLKSSISVRVRYAETDAMKFVYYGNYATYFEVARVELLRQHGMSYKALEDLGIWMPVRDLQIEYLLPANYDDELTVNVCVRSLPSTRMVFEYETYRDEVLLNRGTTTLVFVSSESGRPVRCPEVLMQLLQPYFEDEITE